MPQEHKGSRAYQSAVRWARQFHNLNKVFDGTRTKMAFKLLRWLKAEYQYTSLLDYGCGKGKQFTKPMFEVDGKKLTIQKALNASIKGYDPCWPAYSKLPTGKFDGVYSVDVLCYIPDQDWGWVIERIGNYAKKFTVSHHTIRGVDKLKAHPSIRERNRTVEWTLGKLLALPPHIDAFARIRLDPDNPWHLWRRRPGETSFTWAEELQRLLFDKADLPPPTRVIGLS